jgi:predicted RND superfamily exporter protein
MSSDRGVGAGGEGRGAVDLLSELFERLGVWSYDHRWIVLGVCLLILGVCAVLASGIRFDNSFEAYFDPDDPAYAAYLQYRDDFGSDEVSYILYEAPDHEHGPWNLEVMRKIARLTAALEEEVPFIDEVISLANTEFLDPIPDGIEIFELLEEFPASQEALLEIKQKVLAKPLYVGGLASRDGRSAAIIVEMEKSSIDPLDEIKLDPKGGNDLANLYPQVPFDKIEEILARPEYRGIEFHHTGDVPLNAVINRISTEESATLGGICFVVIGFVLFAFFRRPIGIIGPLAVVALSILMALGLVGLLRWDLDLMFGMLPTLLIAVGVADAVHMVSEFRAYHADLGDRREAVRRTMYLVGTPCLLTSLTTAAGFASMSTAPITTLSRFAVYSAWGVVAAFVLSVTLLVVFLSFGRRTGRRESTEVERIRAKGGQFFLRALEAVARFDARHRRGILAFAGLVFGVSILGIAQLRVDSNFLNDFSEEVPIRETTYYVDRVMGGTNSFIYLFDTGVADGIKEPAVLREVERLENEAAKKGGLVKKTYSVVDVLKDINQSFHDGDPAYHVLPETRELVAQYLLIYEMSGGEEIEKYVSSDFSRTSLELRCRWSESSLLEEMKDDLDRYLAASPLVASTASVTGIGALWLQLTDYITQSQIRGFLLAFVAIAVMLCLLFWSLKIGLLVMIPTVTPALLALGGMGWLDISLDYVRLLIAPVAIGISVDDAIHLVTRYRHEFRRCGDYRQALRASMAEVGRALVITSVVLVLGFLTFQFSEMDSQLAFGALLAGTIFAALVANFFLMPALVMTFEPFGPEGKRGAPEAKIEARDTD